MTISTIYESQRKAARVGKAARIAGFTFLFYIAAGIASLVLSGRATGGEGMAEKFVSIAQHTMEMRIVVLLSLLVVILPLQLAGLFGGAGNWLSAVTWLMWLPMLVYEVALALWLIIKGVAMPTPNVAPPRVD